MSRLLGARGFAAAEVREALDQLTRQGYLDDRRFAANWAGSRLRARPMGLRRLRQELRARGVEETVASAVLREVYEDGEEVVARRAIASKLPTLARLDRTARLARLVRFLERRGFSGELIARLARESRLIEPCDN
jgi:regulatory protein